MDFKLDYGPWEEVFAGKTYNHEVEVVVNPEHFYIVLVYDVVDGKRVGAVIEGYKSFYSRGQVESFIQTLPKHCMGVIKNFGDKTGKLFFLSFEPIYIDFRREDYSRRIDNQIKRIEENSSMMMDLARASSVELKELNLVAKRDYAGIIGDPFLIKLFASGGRGSSLSKIDLTLPDEVEEKEPIIQIGLNKNLEIIKENISNLIQTRIIGEEDGLNYASYIISENLLLDNKSIIVFDDYGYFNQLNIATQNPSALKEELVEFEPMAFPIKEYYPKKNIKISLKDVDLICLLKLIGVKDDGFEKNLSLFSFTAQSNSIEELIQKIGESKELSDYEKLKAERIMRIIELELGELFGQSTPNEELLKKIPGRLGRAIILNTKGLSLNEKIIFTQTMVRQLTKNIGEKDYDSIMVLPKTSYLFITNKERIINSIVRAINRGVNFVLGGEKEFSEELTKLLPTKINVVSKNDVAVMIKGQKTYRVNLRPSLSGKKLF